MLTALETSIFDSIAGLPLHPLVVHFVVVLLPVAALGLILEIIAPKLADRYGWLTILVLAVGTAAAFVSQQAGEALALRVGEPQLHATLGRMLPWAAAALFVVAVIWLPLHRRAYKTLEHRSGASTATGILAALLALIVTALTVFVAHQGATAAWAKVMVPAPPTVSATPVASPTPSETPSTSPTPSTTASPAGFTMAEVAQHAGASSCWTIVNAQVYDVTDWINRHPGGADKILGLCGKDGTSAFQTQHNGQSNPESELSQFLIGPLR
ncbi:MAG: cytochrome b5 domain-containing protein [Actinobacteria bacterium]|nr:cytochrome b5 domain-containing protein [Actinomycetota bacterium]MBU4409958.1 cytochrome b5 domain-containing protein [Actinomycetota bacterium]